MVSAKDILLLGALGGGAYLGYQMIGDRGKTATERGITTGVGDVSLPAFRRVGGVPTANILKEQIKNLQRQISQAGGDVTEIEISPEFKIPEPYKIDPIDENGKDGKDLKDWERKVEEWWKDRKREVEGEPEPEPETRRDRREREGRARPPKTVMGETAESAFKGVEEYNKLVDKAQERLHREYGLAGDVVSGVAEIGQITTATAGNIGAGLFGASDIAVRSVEDTVDRATETINQIGDTIGRFF